MGWCDQQSILGIGVAVLHVYDHSVVTRHWGEVKGP